MQDETVVNIYYCPQCFQNIRQWGLPALSMFEISVEFYISFRMPYKHMPNEKFPKLKIVVDFLEQKGFINTSDISDGECIDIWPRGVKFEDNNYYICVCGSRDSIHKIE